LLSITKEQDFARAILELKDRLRYPINTFEDLAGQLGHKIVVGKDTFKLQDLKVLAKSHFVCESYLPIRDSNDFVNKGHRFYDIVFLNDIWQERQRPVT
jgi:hypothetical protein